MTKLEERGRRIHSYKDGYSQGARGIPRDKASKKNCLDEVEWNNGWGDGFLDREDRFDEAVRRITEELDDEYDEDPHAQN